MSTLGASVADADIRAYSRGAADYDERVLRYSLCADATPDEIEDLRNLLRESELIERLEEV